MALKNPTTTKRKSDASSKGLGLRQAKKPKLDGKQSKKPKLDGKQPNKPKAKPQLETQSDDSTDDGGVPLGLDVDSMVLEEGGQARKTPKSNGTAASNNQTSRERHEEQRRVIKERKLAKPFGQELYRLKKIWERLRRKSHVPREERQTLVKELFEISEGHFKDLVLKHDAVRVVQTALKYSNPMQRKTVAKELQGSYLALASNKYSKFLIDKLLGFEDQEIRDMIIPEFYGNVRKLMAHPDAGWVLDDIYRNAATKQQKALLLREWYGPEFAVFKDSEGGAPETDLCKIFEKEPNKRPSIMASLMELINLMIQKGYTSFTTLHEAMLQYFKAVRVGTDEYRQFMDLCIDEEGDIPKHLPFTEAGSRLASLLLAHGTPKDRKLIIRGFKDAVQMMAIDMYGHAVILAAFEVVDDTVLISKAIISQILATSGDGNKHEVVHLAANDLYARTTLQYLFEGPSRALFPSQLSRDLEILKDVKEIRKTTSKKDPEVRRSELIKAVSPTLISAIEAMPNDMVTTAFGAQFVQDVLLGATGDKSAAVEAVAALAAGNTDDPVHLVNYAFTGRMFKALVQGGKFDKSQGKIIPVSPPLGFADALYEHIKGQEVEWATGRGSFVILGLLECEDFSDRESLQEKLSRHKKELNKAVDTPTKESEENADEKKAKKKKESSTEEKVVGNMGAKLILKHLES